MKFPHLKSVFSYKMQLPDGLTLAGAIEPAQFVPLLDHQVSGRGFVANPITGELVTPLADQNLGYSFTMQFAERIMPAAIVNARLTERIAEIEYDQARKVYSKERRELRESVMMAMAPTALVRDKLVYAFYLSQQQRLFVSGANRKQSDALTSALVEMLGSVKATTIYVSDVKQGLTTRLTQWLQQREDGDDETAFDEFEVGGRVKVIDLADRRQATQLQAEDLSSESLGLLTTLKSGYQVEKIELVLLRTTFTLDSNFRVTRVGYPTFDALPDEDEDDAPWQWRSEASVRLLILKDIQDKLCAMLGHGEPGDVDVDEVPPETGDFTLDDLDDLL